MSLDCIAQVAYAELLHPGEEVLVLHPAFVSRLSSGVTEAGAAATMYARVRAAAAPQWRGLPPWMYSSPCDLALQCHVYQMVPEFGVLAMQARHPSCTGLAAYRRSGCRPSMLTSAALSPSVATY